MDKISQISAPAIAVDLDEAKKRLRLDSDFNEHDAMVTAMANAATNLCEAYSGHQFMQRTQRFYFDDVPLMVCLYDAHPVVAVSSVNYLDANGDDAVLSAENYTVDLFSDPVTIKITETPTTTTADVPNIFWVDVLCGYGANGADAETQRLALPAWGVQAINTQMASMYENPEDKIFSIGNSASGNLIKASEYIMHPFKRNW